jgi:predicted transport protein
MPAEKKGRLQWLKEQYGLGQSSAFLILDRMDKGMEGAAASAAPMRTEDLAEAQFHGENAPLQPLYDWLAGRLTALGEDVKIRPCKTYVPFYRNQVFVYVKPLKGQLHMGIGLPEDTAHVRLEPVGRLGGPERIKLKLVLSSQADAESVWNLVEQAYKLNYACARASQGWDGSSSARFFVPAAT